jgi:hypothetical protein
MKWYYQLRDYLQAPQRNPVVLGSREGLDAKLVKAKEYLDQRGITEVKPIFSNRNEGNGNGS